VSHSLDVLARLSLVVPPRLVDLTLSRSPGSPPAEPAPSASVILLRDGTLGLETYLMQRHARMAFAASMVVFPGGRLEPVDSGGPHDDPIRACALRETLEETGVALAADDLHPWAHWITPEAEPRRYDTQFFVARMPADQHAQDISGETDDAAWWSPDAALQAERSGAMALMPPTLSIMLELADHDSVAAVLAAAENRAIECVLPALVQTADGWRFSYPSPSEKRS
jgi:8-oxo-dGTP pyrophosphatase MutT (NUDIX family)